VDFAIRKSFFLQNPKGRLLDSAHQRMIDSAFLRENDDSLSLCANAALKLWNQNVSVRYSFWEFTSATVIVS